MNSGVRVAKWKRVSKESDLANVMGTIGPVTAYIYASTDNFRFYEVGIYSYTECDFEIHTDHAVNLFEIWRWFLFMEKLNSQ